MMLAITVDSGDTVQRIEQAIAEVDTRRASCLEQMGTQLLSFAQLDYVTKARGGTGTDGITWAKDQRSTIEARVRSRAPAKRIVERRRELAARIREVIRQRSGRGKDRKAWAKSQLVSLRKQRKALTAKLQAMVDQEYTHYEIGVDTGLQRASAQPGFMGPDGQGGNVFTVDQYTVTIGYGRSYSKYFDALRPLLPETLPATWTTALEAIAEKHAVKIVETAFK